MSKVGRLKTMGHSPLRCPTVFILESPMGRNPEFILSPYPQSSLKHGVLPKASQLEGRKVRIWTLALWAPKHHASLSYTLCYCSGSHSMALTPKGACASQQYFPHLGKPRANPVHKYHFYDQNCFLNESNISIFAPATFLRKNFSMMQWQNLLLAKGIIDTHVPTNIYLIVSWPK